MYIVSTPQDPTSWLLYRGGLLIQWNLCIVATPQDPTSWLLYRGDLLIQWNLCIYSDHPTGPNQLAAIQRWPAHTVEPVYTSWLLYRGGLLIQWNLCIDSAGPNQLAAIQRWPAAIYRGGLLVQWNLCIVATPQDPTSWLLYRCRGGQLISGTCV